MSLPRCLARLDFLQRGLEDYKGPWESVKKPWLKTCSTPAGLIMTSLHTSASHSITICRHMFHMISSSNLKGRMLVCRELEFLLQYDMVVHIEFHPLSHLGKSWHIERDGIISNTIKSRSTIQTCESLQR
jgi:hypothetical protein